MVEAHPPADSVTSLTADLLLEPDGALRLLGTGDQLHAEYPLRRWGVSAPQSSVDPARLNAATRAVAEACRARGVVGHFSVDFVTFIDPKTVSAIRSLLVRPANGCTFESLFYNVICRGFELNHFRIQVTL